ncbi:MAG: VOC family protein [Dehalococcoidales bacterium]|nr:VOC family protein [Dehalococcoidales bacterium]
MFKKLNHVSHIVENLEEALKLYEDILRLKPWAPGIVELKKQGARLVWLPIGDNFIELIEPTDSNNRFARHLKEKGEGLFHLSIFAEDYDKEIAELKAKGYEVDEETFVFQKDSVAKLAFLSPNQTKGAWIEILDMASIKF